MSSQYKPVEWSYNTNIYEVNLRQYTQEGTFAAFEKELPRLKDMGIEVLWFMPVTPISQEKRLGTLGSYYACSDYTSTNPEFGSLEDFKQLVQTAHGMGFKVLIDWVANHTGWDHRWTREHPDFYKRNYEGNFYDANGWEDVIDLNFDNPAVSVAMIEAMRFWITECNIDGFRCDMAMLVRLDFWRTAREELDKVKKLFWLAECEEISYHEVFDATYSWNLLHKMEAFARHETNISGLDEVLNYYSGAFPPGAFHLLMTTNHDENSHSGSEYERLGNVAEAFSVLCCTWNGIPLIYSGQELPNKKRLKFFDKDQIEWTGTYALHNLYKKLFSLRKNNAAMRAGESSKTYRLKTEADQFVFAFLRKSDQGEVLVVMNLSDQEKPFFDITDDLLSGSFVNILSDNESNFTEKKHFALRPWEYLIYAKDTLLVPAV